MENFPDTRWRRDSAMMDSRAKAIAESCKQQPPKESFPLNEMSPDPTERSEDAEQATQEQARSFHAHKMRLYVSLFLGGTMSENEKDEYQGVKIQKLPTMGKPVSNKGYRWKPRDKEFEVKDQKMMKKIRELAKVLKD